jgi:adenosylcobinamide-GDP ribazoletransferase
MTALRHFLLALQFFTRIPVTGRLADWVGFSPAMLRASAAYFPAVGAVIGGLVVLLTAAMMHYTASRGIFWHGLERMADRRFS